MRHFIALVFFSTILVLLAAANRSYAQEAPRIRDIIIKGAQRSDPASILLQIPLQIGQTFDAEKMDQALKNLYATGRFENVALLRKGSNLVVELVEAPIINLIAFEGNKVVKDPILESETSLRSLKSLSKTQVQRDVERVLQLYRRYGRFAAQVRPRIIKLEENRVNLVYEILEGRRTKIRKIAFLGNNSFSRKKLLDRIYSRQARFYRILGRQTYYSVERFAADRQAIENFYHEHGFAQAQVIGASAELSRDKRGFILTISINEGERFRLRNVSFKTDIEDIDQKPISKILARSKVKQGRLFKTSRIETARVRLLDKLNEQGVTFVDIEVIPNFDVSESQADLVFNVQRITPKQVAQVEIVGNDHTLDRVIRREISINPGDVLQPLKIRQSIRRLQKLGYFEAVTPEIIETQDPQRVIVRFIVKERATGKIEAGAGYSTQEAFFGQFSFGENNFRGRGQKFELSGTISKNTQKTSVTYSQRYLGKQPINPFITLGISNREKRDDTAYGILETNLGTGISLDIGKGWSNSWQVNYSFESIKDLDPTVVSEIVLADTKICPCHTLSLGYAFTYNGLNNPVNPNKGQWLRLRQTIADFGTTSRYLRSEANYIYLLPVYKSSFLKFDSFIGNITPLGKPLRITERYRTKIRGFRLYGTGARENDIAIGNENFAKVSLDFNFSIGIPEEIGIRGLVFLEAGLPFGLSSDSNYKENYKLRASGGGGILWKTPVGPLQFIWAKPFSKESFDKEELFYFTVGTSF